MNELAKRICDLVSDGYDDEEYRNESEEILAMELNALDNDIISAVFSTLCDMLEEAMLETLWLRQREEFDTLSQTFDQ